MDLEKGNFTEGDEVCFMKIKTDLHPGCSGNVVRVSNALESGVQDSIRYRGSQARDGDRCWHVHGVMAKDAGQMKPCAVLARNAPNQTA